MVSAVEVNLIAPIDIAVESWCGDAVALVEVVGEVDADSCAALAAAVAQAARTYRAVIIDFTHVRLLSAAGLHCLDCVGQVQDGLPGVVHLVCAEASAVRELVQQVQLHHRWPVHADVADAVRQVMGLFADRPEPTNSPPPRTPSGVGSRPGVSDGRVGARPA